MERLWKTSQNRGFFTAIPPNQVGFKIGERDAILRSDSPILYIQNIMMRSKLTDLSLKNRDGRLLCLGAVRGLAPRNSTAVALWSALLYIFSNPQ